MIQLLIRHERQDQFDNKLYVLENNQEALNNKVSEVEDAVAKVADLQIPRSKPGSTNPK